MTQAVVSLSDSTPERNGQPPSGFCDACKKSLLHAFRISMFNQMGHLQRTYEYKSPPDKLVSHFSFGLIKLL